MDAVLCTHLNSRGVYGAKVLVTVMIMIRVGVRVARSTVFDRTARFLVQGLWPDLQNILRQSYDYLMIMRKLRSSYDGRLIYKTS